MTGLKWTRKTTHKVSTELKRAGIDVCPRTVARLLTDLDYRLRVNHKKLCVLLSSCLSHRQSLRVICDGSRGISRIASPGGRMLEGGAKWYGQGARIAALRYH